jgi:signal transduction histidine kinase
MLWYGTLFVVALGCFATFVLVMATNAINSSVDNAVNAEARVATLALERKLFPNPPYWPQQLLLPTIDTYRDPGVAVEILDAQGHIRYYSASDTATSIPLSPAARQAVLEGKPPILYTSTVGNEHVRVEALSVRAPLENSEEIVVNPDGTLAHGGPIIGVLLVAKSLNDIDSTLFLLKTLILISGLVTLAGTLLVSWILATHVLRPLTGLMTTARAIAASTARGTRPGNLSQRVYRHRGQDEMAQVIDTFNAMLDSLESATQAQRRFVADASHELRAPLTTIQGNLAFLQRHLRELPPEEQRTMLADAHGETLRLAQLVEELLLLARADASEDRSVQVPQAIASEEDSAPQQPLVELDHTMLQLVRQMRRRLNVEGSEVKLEIGHIEAVRVRGDEEIIRRVILILLDNALKYTPGSNGANTGIVTVSLERKDRQAVLSVHDTGIGIGPDDLPHIFERFYRADRARSRHGTGLGLSIAQVEVEQLGGHITAESTLGKGSIFKVWLPLA